MTTKKWLLIFSSVLLIVTYFLPWVTWGGTHVAGHAPAAGSFFTVLETKLSLPGNPYPKLSFLFLAFWLIPILPATILFQQFAERRSGLLPYVAAFLSLSLITLFALFSDLGTGQYFGFSTIWYWLHLLGAIVLVLSAEGGLLKKIGWLVIGPILVFGSFKIIEKKFFAEGQKNTATEKADFTMSAEALMAEFLRTDSSANKKYIEKMIQVDGPASAIDIAADSTSTIKFADSTGSYAIFSFEKADYPDVKTIKAGDNISLKGVCSGSIYSEILGTISISFKRSIINKATH